MIVSDGYLAYPQKWDDSTARAGWCRHDVLNQNATFNFGSPRASSNSPGGRQVSRQRVRAGVTLTVFIAVTALAAAVVAVAAMSLSNDKSTGGGPSPAAQNDAVPTTSALPSTSDEPLTTTEAPPTTSAIRSTFDKIAGGLKVEIGDCVEIGHSGDTATLGKATCGSATSNYKIIEKATENSACPSDADRTLNDTLRGINRAALCLDIDWVVGGCMDPNKDNPKRIDCAAKDIPNGVRVVEIKQNTANVNVCSASDSGIVYQQRQFVVCVHRL
ncbi:LppU family putative lipoprotein [Nocardia sp. CA-107356]|uniref:LppU family putative lipoprotein n=1 Tax=Nocardia sp. CA-107356 TaxID=3239972 RepID=UPI003D941FAF